MGDWDLFKVLAMFEHVFGNKWGYRLFCFFSGIGLLSFLFLCLGIIWANGGEWLFTKLSGFNFPGLTIGLDNLSSLILTLMVVISIFGAVLIFVLFWVAKNLQKRPIPQSALNRLWDLRSVGIKLRNESFDAQGDFNTWVETFNEWRKDLLDTAENTDTNLRQYLENLDRMEPMPITTPSFNDEHDRKRHIMSEILLRLQRYLEKRL